MFGPVLCGRKKVRVAIKAFCMSIDLRTPDQAEEVAQKETLLQRSPRMFMELGQERIRRMKALVKAVSMAKKDGRIEVPTGAAIWGSHRLCRMEHRRQVLSIPDGDGPMQERQLLCAHMQQTGYRGVDVTLVRLRGCCAWLGMDENAPTLIGEDLYRVDSRRRGLVPRTNACRYGTWHRVG